MQKPPLKKATQDGFIKSAIRLPPSLHAEMADVALRTGHSLNDEIISRCQALPIQQQLQALTDENAQIRAMIKELLDLVGTKR